MPKKKGARYLDVGCGGGNFLKFVKEQGMVPFGVDFFIHAENKELNIRKVHLLDAGFPEDYFDFITLNNVLEHVENPMEILSECKRIAKKGGKIIINVPNTSSLQYLLFSSAWVSLDPPRHLFTFSKKTLKRYAKKVGLICERINYKSEPFSILGSLVAASRSVEKSISGSKLIANRWINILVLPFSILLNLFRISDQVEIILRKD
jgi:ubiquinone/menaquinone biosynthesis C-methylase UbiE